MGLKLFKAGWFLSMLATLTILLFAYAGLPEMITVHDSGESPVVISRETFFYAMTAIIVVVNLMVYLVSRTYKTDLDLRAWFHGLVICLNIFLITSMKYIELFNSGEKYDYSSIRIIIFGSVGLFVAWIIGWPFYLLYRKFFIKETVESN